jgi:hypothetical protein
MSDTLSFDQFAPLPDLETWIRNELSISGNISLYKTNILHSSGQKRAADCGRYDVS